VTKQSIGGINLKKFVLTCELGWSKWGGLMQ